MVLAGAYFAALLVFIAIDGVWLSVMGPVLYKPILGDILLLKLRIAPAIAFYLAYPIGIVAFAVVPALRADSLVTAAGLGVLFGALAYATYDLTNYATLKNWTFSITAVDITYGAIASGVAACAAYAAARALSGWLGSAS